MFRSPQCIFKAEIDFYSTLAITDTTISKVIRTSSVPSVKVAIAGSRVRMVVGFEKYDCALSKRLIARTSSSSFALLDSNRWSRQRSWTW